MFVKLLKFVAGALAMSSFIGALIVWSALLGGA